MDGLDLVEFVRLLLAEVPCEENEKIELINGAINIFSDVDINGDGNMSWNEFVQYIVNQVEQVTLVPMINPDTGKLMTIEDQLTLNEVTTFKRFKVVRNLIDKGSHRR